VNASRVERSRRGFKTEKEWVRTAGFFYSDYSVWHRFEAICVFSVFSVVRMHRNGRRCSLSSIERRFPKLSVHRFLIAAFGCIVIFQKKLLEIYS
jgi:hypothetical protein